MKVCLKDEARALNRTLKLNRRPDLTEENSRDVQALCVAEEAGEMVGAYRRYTGRARRLGTRKELEHEIADVLITTAVFADIMGIDIDQALGDKLNIIYARGWKEEAA